MIAATVADLDAFLLSDGYVVTGDKGAFLSRAYRYISGFEVLEDTPDQVLIDAQLFTVLAIENGFDPSAPISDSFMTRKGLGRNAIEKEWEQNESSAGNSILKRLLRGVPMAHDVLEPWLVGETCPPMGFN